MTLSYLVSTAGHAQSQNDQHPHDVRNILQLIEEGAEELGDEKVVGFTTLAAEWTWHCQRLCEWLLIDPGPACGSKEIVHSIVVRGQTRW